MGNMVSIWVAGVYWRSNPALQGRALLGKPLPKHWMGQRYLTLNSVLLLAFWFCTLHTITLVRVPAFWLSLIGIRYNIFYTLLFRTILKCCVKLILELHNFYISRFPMLSLFHFLIISSNFLWKLCINLELPLHHYHYIVSKMRTHSMYLGY